MKIRKTEYKDIDKIMEIFDYARNFMRENNNHNQWINGYPSKENVENDINNKHSYVCLDDNNNIIGTFCFLWEKIKIMIKYMTVIGLMTKNTE